MRSPPTLPSQPKRSGSSRKGLSGSPAPAPLHSRPAPKERSDWEQRELLTQRSYLQGRQLLRGRADTNSARPVRPSRRQPPQGAPLCFTTAPEQGAVGRGG